MNGVVVLVHLNVRTSLQTKHTLTTCDHVDVPRTWHGMEMYESATMVRIRDYALYPTVTWPFMSMGRSQSRRVVSSWVCW